MKRIRRLNQKISIERSIRRIRKGSIRKIRRRENIMIKKMRFNK
jgi:hypothetical protein